MRYRARGGGGVLRVGRDQRGQPLNHVLAGLQAREHLARPAAHQAADRAVAQIHDQVPACADGLPPQAQPMAVIGLLDHFDQANHLGNLVEQRRGQRPAGNGDLRAGVTVDQHAQNAGRQNRIAQPVGGDE